jgi:hypothetical protein
MRQPKVEDNKVYPDNRKIHYLYFLVEVSVPGGGHVTSFLMSQANVGPIGNRSEMRLWNHVAGRLSDLTERTGLFHRTEAVGSREFCLLCAREKGWDVTA